MAFKSRYPHAFSPLEIRGVTFRNRLWQAPPGCFFSGDERGFVTEKFVNYFRQYARGGVTHRELADLVVAEGAATREKVDARCDALDAKLDRIESKLDKLIELATPRLPDGMSVAE